MNGQDHHTSTPTTPKSSNQPSAQMQRQRGIDLAEITQRVKEIIAQFKQLQNAESFQANVDAIVAEHPDPVQQLPAMTVALMLEVKKQHDMDGNIKKALVLAILDLVIFRFAPAGTHEILHEVSSTSIDVMFSLSKSFKESKIFASIKSLKCCC
jgi:hypothetical protein